MRRLTPLYASLDANQIHPDSRWVTWAQGGYATPLVREIHMLCRDVANDDWRQYPLVATEEQHAQILETPLQARQILLAGLDFPVGEWTPSEPSYDFQERKWRGWRLIDEQWDQHAAWLAAEEQTDPYEWRGIGFLRVLESAGISYAGPLKQCELKDVAHIAPQYLRSYLMNNRLEGIVWHHPDGRVAAIKRSEFGILGEDQ